MVCKTYSLGNGSGDCAFDELENCVRSDFPEVRISLDKKLSLFRDLAEGLGAWKRVTVRYKPNHIRIPSFESGQAWIPVFETDKEDKNYLHRWGEVQISTVIVSTVREFPQELAVLDGFESKKDLLTNLEGIYTDIYPEQILLHGGILRPDEFLSCYAFGETRSG